MIHLLVTDQLFNPAFLEELGWTRFLEWGGVAATLTAISVLGIATWDVIEGFRKARRRTEPGS